MGKKQRQTDRYNGYIKEYNDPNTTEARKKEIATDVEALLNEIDSNKLKNSLKESWNNKKVDEGFVEQELEIQGRKEESQKFLDQWNKLFEEYPEYKESLYLNEIKNVIDKANEQGYNIFENTDQFIKENANITGEKQINEISKALNSAEQAYRIGGDTMLSSFAKTYSDAGNNLNNLYGTFSANTNQALNDYKQNSSLAEQALGATLGLYQSGGAQALNEYNKGADKIEAFYKKGGDTLANAYKDAVNVASQGGQVAIDVYKTGFDQQAAQYGIGQKTLEQGVQEMKNLSAEAKNKINVTLNSGIKQQLQGAQGIVSKAATGGSQLEQLYGQGMAEAQKSGQTVKDMIAKDTQNIEQQAKQGFDKSLETARQGYQQGIDTYKSGIDKGIGQYEQGIGQLKSMANQNQLPGQDILEGKFDAKTQQAVQQLKELGGGSANTLNAVAQTLGGQDEYLRDLAVEAANMKQQNQKDYAGALMQSPGVYQNAYGGLADMQTNASSSLANIIQNQTGQMSDIYSKNLASKMAGEQYSFDAQGNARDQYGNVISGNLARDIQAQQYQNELLGQSTDKLTNMYQQNLNTDLGIAGQSQNIANAQFELSNLIGKGYENLSDLERQRANDLSATLQGYGQAGSSAAQLQGQGIGQATDYRTQGINQYMQNVGGQTNNMAQLYNQRAGDLAGYGTNYAQNLANYGMQGNQMMAGLGQDYGQAAMNYGQNLGNLYTQGGGMMADAYGNYGQNMNNAYLNSNQLANQYLNNYQQGQLGYYDQAMAEQNKAYQYNQAMPWNMQAGFAEQNYMRTDPFNTQMQYLGDVTGTAYANVQQAMAAENARKAANAQIWGSVIGVAGTAGGALLGKPS